MTELIVELKACPECGQDSEFFFDEERETVTCICGAIISEPVFH
ncbi:hypothetical protein [uncultured Photobacterium sp.]|nr:hypothetical protein [uncultured Photobacterium sp.]